MNVTNTITSTRAARAAFLSEIPDALRKRYRRGHPQNKQPCDIRAAWCDWIDAAQKDGRMCAKLADTAIL